MPLSTFQRADLPYFKKAFAEPTHSAIDDVDFVLGYQTKDEGMTKAQRAAKLVDYALAGQDSDAILLAIVNVLYFEHQTEEERNRSIAFRDLHDRIFSARGVRFHGNKGFQMEVGTPVSAPEDVSRPAGTLWDSLFPNDGIARAPVSWASETSTSGSAPSRSASVVATNGAPSEANGRPNSVFIVQGRDERPVVALEQFLHFLGMDIVTWGDARSMLRVAQPATFDIVKAGLERSGAVIVLFSPDEEARLRAELSGVSDPKTGEAIPSEVGAQPRQNVLLEAGLAFGLAPDRTIFVRSGRMRDISDIVGFNFINMTGEWKQREALLDALRAAGTTPSPKRTNLMDSLAGPFRVTDWT